MKIKLPLVLLAACVLFIAPARADDPKKAEPKKVPFELLKSGHMAVQVKVNGKGPYRLVFDTGAPMLLINNKLSKAAGVTDKNTKGPPLAIFGAMGQFTIKEFELGELKAKDVACVVMDHPTLGQMAQIFGPIDGIVGFPFFARYKMTIDYQAKELTFVPTDFQPTNIFDALMKLMMNPPKKGDNTKFLAPPATWGFNADKGTTDEYAGLDVSEVLKDSPAAKAGLEIGDRLLTIDGRWTDSVIDLFEAAGYVKPGQTVPMQIERKGKKMELKVAPAKGL